MENAASGGTLGSRGELMRQQLLDTAIEQFGTVGYRDASVSQIARSCGVKQAAVYRYYANKQALFDAAVIEEINSILDAVEAGPELDSFVDWFARYVLRFQDEVGHRPLAHRVLANHEGDTLHRLIDSSVVLRIEAAMADGLRRGQRNASVRADIVPDVMARGLEKLVLALTIAQCTAGVDPRAGSIEGLIAVAHAALLPVSVASTAD